MSLPQNILSKYRSYSYYHVLAICDRSATADALSQSTTLDVWQHDPSTEIRTIDGSQMSDRHDGQYVILINGSTDTDFVISEARWYGATASEATSQDQGTSCAIEGSLKILEPRGVIFCDQVVLSCLALGIDSANAVWVLKTFFVGYYTDAANVDSIEYISDIAPVQFIVYDLTGNFTEAGGSYELPFVALSNGASRLPQYSKAVDGITFTPGSGKSDKVTLKDAIVELFDHINVRYSNHFNCVIQYVTATAPVGVSGADEVARYYPVQYIFVSDDFDYSDPKYVISDAPEQFKNSPQCYAPPTIKTPSSIEDALHALISKCPLISDEMSAGIPVPTPNDGVQQVRYEYKILTTVESVITPYGPVARVIYKIKKFPTPKDNVIELLSRDQLTPAQQEQTASKAAQNLITFDYIYSGKNIDILKFDLKLNLGMAYLQTATISNTFAQQLDIVPPRSTYVNKFIDQSTRFSSGDTIRKSKIPVFLGTQIRTPHLNNTQNQPSAVQAAYTMSKHAALEVSDVQMEIFGNPVLLGSVNRTSSVGGIQDIDPQKVDPHAATGYPHWGLYPAYAKVNVYMPSSNDDLAIMQSHQGDYAKKFWFDGYYYVIAVEHSFVDGLFTQTLSMLGLPQPGNLQQLQQSRTGDQAYDQILQECMEGGTDINVRCQGTLSGVHPESTPAIPYTTPNQLATPITNGERLLGTNWGANCPGAESLIGWLNAPQEVQTAITNAAKQFPVINGDPACTAQYLAAISWFESSWRPYVVNNIGAAGLFQFVRTTWSANYNAFVKLCPLAGVSAPPKPTNNQDNNQPWMQLRTNAAFAAYAAAVFTSNNIKEIGSSLIDMNTYGGGDLYIAHVFGNGGCKAVLQAIRDGKGQYTFEQACNAYNVRYGKVSPSTIINRNPVGGISSADSCSTIRIKVANALYSRTIGVVKATYDTTPSTQQAPTPAQQTVQKFDVPTSTSNVPTACTSAAAVRDKDKAAAKPTTTSCNSNQQQPTNDGSKGQQSPRPTGQGHK